MILNHRILPLFILAFILFSTNSFAQKLWQSVSKEDKSSYLSQRQSNPATKMSLHTLNAALLQAKLAQVTIPKRTGKPLVEVDFPLMDESFITAYIYESPILSSGMQALVPGLKTYSLVDKFSGSSRGRVTVNENGITAILFTDKGTAYIHPVTQSGNRVHASYFFKDVPKGLVHCGVDDVDNAEARAARSALSSRATAGDGNLRTYRLAVAATGEYVSWAGSQANALAYITTTVNNVNAIYERDATISFTLVTNNSILYTDNTTDPYPTLASPNGTLLDINNSATNTQLGAGAYDIGIVFNNAWDGGLAQLESVCTVNHGRSAAGLTFGSGSNPTLGPQGPIFEGTVAHEIAHQFSATHTMASTNGGCASNTTLATAFEPGGGSTLMAYAGICTGNSYQNNSDLYFHIGSVIQISKYATEEEGNNCPILTDLPNVAPVVTVAQPSYNIPVSTPFLLTAVASDVNNNSLTYTWEQMDGFTLTTTPPSATATAGPNFRSFPPSENSFRYFPNLASVVAGTAQTYEVLSSVARTMNFKVNVRDNAAGAGANTQADVAVTTVAAAGPFIVTSQSTPVSLTANASNTFTITWNVANTTAAPINCSTVDILFSADGGGNFNYSLLSNTANDGSETIVVPNIATSIGRIMVKSVGNIFFNVNSANITIATNCNAEGALLSPTNTVSAAPGAMQLNLSSAPLFGNIISSINGTLESSDPASTLAVFNSTNSSCINFSNQFKYDAYSFQVNVAGTYIFTKSAGGYIINVYQGAFNPSSVCSGFLTSNGRYNGTTVTVLAADTVNLIPGLVYTLTVGTFNASTPTLPFNYTITATSMSGGNVYSGYPNPGSGFSYQYVIVSKSTGNIIAISSTPDLRNSSTFPQGTYTVYGFSYETVDFNSSTLNSYIGMPYSTLSNDVLNDPAAHCGNISKNNVAVNIFQTLPLSLLPLTALRETSVVNLYWSTASETDTKEFEIERSSDGFNFNSIQTVAAAGTSIERIDYAAIDNAPLTGNSYYRIKAFDYDGNFKYTNIATVKSSTVGLSVSTYPNPVTDNLTFQIVSLENGAGTLEIVSMSGSIVHQKNIYWKKGSTIETLSLKHLPAAVYYLKLKNSNKPILHKLIKL